MITTGFLGRCMTLCILCGLVMTGATADTLSVNGQLRTYTAIVPLTAHAVPLVLVLHGNTQQGRDMVRRTSWPAVAQANGFVAVFPDGLNTAWADLRADDERFGRVAPAGTDDVAFLLALVNHFVAAGIADPHRIYVTGVSNGAAMTMALACQHPGTFAAAASVIMNLTQHTVQACTPATGIPLLMMNGTDDPVIPFAGGATSHKAHGKAYLSTDETLYFWRRVNGCVVGDAGEQTLPDTDTTDHSTVTRVTSHCPAGTGVVLYRVNGGGHRMPDVLRDSRHRLLVNAVLGQQNHDINGPLVIWDFLKQFRREQP